jgi:hypothetical protein
MPDDPRHNPEGASKTLTTKRSESTSAKEATCGCGRISPLSPNGWRTVVDRLITQENDNNDQSRMRAEGVGFLAPVATNDTADGRAKNRWVELVKQ